MPRFANMRCIIKMSKPLLEYLEESGHSIGMYAREAVIEKMKRDDFHLSIPVKAEPQWFWDILVYGYVSDKPKDV